MDNSLEKKISEVFREVFAEQNQSGDPPELTPDSVLLETGLDSLGFALLVVRLEETLGFDPFVLSSEAFYPRTFGDFVAFYEANQPT
jgi:Acyl carrier protein